MKLSLGCPVLVAFSRAGLLTWLPKLASTHWIDANQSRFLSRVKRETTPGPIFGVCDQFPFYRIHVHVKELLDEFRLTPDIEIVKARLPELRQNVRVAKRKPELVKEHHLARLAAQSPRNALLQHLHNGRRGAFGRLIDEQVNMIGHHDVAREGKPVTVTDLAQNLHKHILCTRRGKQGQSPVTTTGDEVQMEQAIATAQSFGHIWPHQEPRP